MEQKNNVRTIAWKFTWPRDCLTLFFGTISIFVSIEATSAQGLKNILKTHCFCRSEEKEIFEYNSLKLYVNALITELRDY